MRIALVASHGKPGLAWVNGIYRRMTNMKSARSVVSLVALSAVGLGATLASDANAAYSGSVVRTVCASAGQKWTTSFGGDHSAYRIRDYCYLDHDAADGFSRDLYYSIPVERQTTASTISTAVSVFASAAVSTCAQSKSFFANGAISTLSSGICAVGAVASVQDLNPSTITFPNLGTIAVFVQTNPGNSVFTVRHGWTANGI